MLIYPIFFPNNSAHRFSYFLFPAASSVFLLFYLFSLSSLLFLLKKIPFAEKASFVPESKQSLNISNCYFPFVSPD